MPKNSLARWAATIATICVASTAFAQERPKQQPVPGTIDWVFDYEQGKLESQKSGKPIFAVIRCER